MLTWVELCNDLNNGLFYFVFQEFVQSLGPVIFLKQKKSFHCGAHCLSCGSTLEMK